MLVQSACEETHERDAEVYDAAKQTEFELIHPEILLHLGGAGRQDAVVEVDEYVCEDHEGEDEGWRFALLEAFAHLLIHILIYRIDNII